MRRKVRDMGYSIPCGKCATAKECCKESSDCDHFWRFDCQAIGRSKEMEETAEDEGETTEEVVNNGEITEEVVIREKTTEKVVEEETTKEVVEEETTKEVVEETVEKTTAEEEK
jgi:hypothetical protein